jgi:hypothetical protein
MNDNELDAQTIAASLARVNWADSDEKSYSLINRLDQQRRGGSRISTARDIVEELARTKSRYPGKSAAEFGPGLSLVLEWLYYRR